MNKVSPSGLAGCNHKILSSLILIIIALMWPQHQAYGIGQLHVVNVPTPLLLWVRTPVMSPQLQTLPSPSQPEVGVGKLVQVLLHPMHSVSFSYIVVMVGHLIIGHVCRFNLASFPGPARSSLAVRNSRRGPGLIHHVMSATVVFLRHQITCCLWSFTVYNGVSSWNKSSAYDRL